MRFIEKDGFLAPHPEELEKSLEPKCPAARIGRYADSGNVYLQCGVEKVHFPVTDSPVSVVAWCCDKYTDCTSWQAAVDNDPNLKRMLEAREQAERDAMTKRQIEAGIRVDDRGIEGGIGEQEIIRAIEEAEE